MYKVVEARHRSDQWSIHVLRWWGWRFVATRTGSQRAMEFVEEHKRMEAMR